jgi:1-phosphofructokinase
MKQKVITVTMNPSIDKTVELNQLIPYGLNRAKSSRLDPGGKGINVGRILQNFGVDVTATGLIAGNQGKALLDQLDACGLDHDFLQVEGETRTNLKVIDESVNKVTEINEQGFLVTEEQAEEFLGKLEIMSAEAEIVILSGSLPPGISIDYYARCIRIAKSKGAKVLLDAEGPALLEGLNAVPFAVKPNQQELGTLFHTEFNNIGQVAEAATKLADKGVEIVIVSLGPEGGVFANRNEIFKADSWDIPVKSTVGGGDAMVGALAYSMLRGDSLYDAARFATAAGTVTVSKAGTQFCNLDEVQGSVGKVFIRDIQLHSNERITSNLGQKWSSFY